MENYLLFLNLFLSTWVHFAGFIEWRIMAVQSAAEIISDFSATDEMIVSNGFFFKKTPLGANPLAKCKTGFTREESMLYDIVSRYEKTCHISNGNN